MLPREDRESEDLGFRFVHQGADLGVAAGEFVADLVPPASHRCQVGLGEDGAEHGSDHFGLTLGDVGQHVADEVDSAG